MVSVLSSKHHHHILSGYFLSINHPQFPTLLAIHSLLLHCRPETINFIDCPCVGPQPNSFFKLKYFLAGQWVKYFLGVLTLWTALDPGDESWCLQRGIKCNYRSRELSILPLSIPGHSLSPPCAHSLLTGLNKQLLHPALPCYTPRQQSV